MASGKPALMLPPAARPTRRQHEVLEEDEYVQRIEAIIQRDFFPDLPKLQNKLEWLQAVQARDPEAMRQAQLNIVQRRMGIKTPVGATPGTMGVPGTSILRSALPRATPGATPTWGTTPGTVAGAGEAAARAHLAPQDPPLDRFFAEHTGEDNAAYQEIAEASRKRKRDAKTWLFEDKGPQRGSLALEAPPAGNSGSAAAPGEGLPRLQSSGQAQQLQGQHGTFTGACQPPQQVAALQASAAAGSHQPAESKVSAGPSQAQQCPLGVAAVLQSEAGLESSPQRAMVPNPGRPLVSTDDFGTGGQTDQTLTSWPYVNKNALYYDSSQRDSVPLTDSEKAALVQGPPKQIKHAATRMHPEDEASEPAPGGGQKPRYEVMATPSFTPGPDESPLMTWGDLAGTPLRLEAEDDIHVSAGEAGPAFAMTAQPRRDELGRSMAQKSTASLKRRSELHATTPLRQALQGARATATRGIRKVACTPSRLSAAGKRLASNLRGKTSAADRQLRASYTAGTPSRKRPDTGGEWGASPTPVPRRRGTASTPVVHPGRMARAQPSAAAAQAPVRPAPDANITDNLLQI